jgi:GDPmannose 4,6-dehydratase
MLRGELEYALEDADLNVKTDKGNIIIVFDKSRFRVADAPILMSDTRKIQSLGFKVTKSLEYIIRVQVNYCLNPSNGRM